MNTYVYVVYAEVTYGRTKVVDAATRVYPL